MLLFSKFPSEPLANIPPELRSSTANTFGTLLSDPDFNPVIVLKAFPFNITTEKTKSLFTPLGTRGFPLLLDSSDTSGTDLIPFFVSDTGFITKEDDASYPNIPIKGRLKPSINFSTILFSGDEPDGRGRSTFGNIGILNLDADFDFIINYGWDGAEFQLLAGKQDIDINDFGVVYEGYFKNISWNISSIELSISDRGSRLELPIERTKYDGTLDEGGDSSIAGLNRPLVFGQVRNIEPTLVEASSLLYQVHDGQIEAINSVRDRGVALSFSSDFATVSLLLAATAGSSGDDIEAGEYGTCLADGYFRLGAIPDGKITADVQGDKTGGVYIDTAPEIVKRLAMQRVNGSFNFEISQIDNGSFSTLSNEQPAVVGMYVGNEQRKLSEIMSEIMKSIGGYWYFGRSNLFTVGRLELPIKGDLEISEKNILSMDRLEYFVPVYERRLGYKRMWTVQGDEDFAASVTDEDRQLYRNEYRISEKTASGVKNKHKLARSISTASLFDLEADAETESQRLLDLHQSQKDVYSIVVKRLFFRLFVGDDVTINYPRYNLSAGKNFKIIGIQENENQTTLELWG